MGTEIFGIVRSAPNFLQYYSHKAVETKESKIHRQGYYYSCVGTTYIQTCIRKTLRIQQTKEQERTDDYTRQTRRMRMRNADGGEI